MADMSVGSAYLNVIPKLSSNAASQLGAQAQTLGGGLGSKMGSATSKAFGVGVVAVGNMIANAATQAASAFGQFITDSISTGAGFDSAMSQVAATMGKTVAQMNDDIATVDLGYKTFTGNLTEYALEMGSSTVFSATQAAEALNYMALAGYKTDVAMQMLPSVLNLAAAGGMDLARASDMVTDTQTAFGLTLERTTKMVDEMAKAASTGNTSVEQLGDAFLVVGGLAQELNGGFITLKDGTTASVDGLQELEIALTAMANASIKGSEAGTHMRNMLLKLASPTSDGTKLLEEMGVSVFDAEGRMRSLSDVFKDLNASLSTMTQEQKISAISELFNARDIASAEALLNAISQDWDEIGESIINAEGAAKLMADVQLDNFEGDVTLLNSALEGLQVRLWHGVEPAFRGVVQAVTAVITGFNDLLSGGVQAPAFLQNAMERLAPSAARVGEAFQHIADIIGGAVSPVFAAFGLGITRNIGDPLEFVVNLLTSGLEFALDNIAIPALELFADLLENVVAPAAELLADVLLHNIGPALFDISNAVSDYLLTVFTEIGATLSEIVLPALVEFGEWFTAEFGPAIEFVGGLVAEYIVESFKRAGESIEFAAFVISTFIGFLSDTFGPVIQTIGQSVADTFTYIKDSVHERMEAMRLVVDTVVSAIREFLAFTGLADAVHNVFENVKRFIQDPIGQARDFVRNIPSEIIGYFSGLGYRISQAFGSIHFPAPHISWSSVDVFGWNIPIPNIQFYKRGGFVGDETLFAAGEAGTEFIWPSYEPYMSQYADALASRISGGPQVTITGNEFNVRDDRDIEAIADALVNRWQTESRAGVWAA